MDTIEQHQAAVPDADPPRLEVAFNLKDGTQEQFGWCLRGTGGMPLMTLTGYIARVQAWLLCADSVPACDESKLIIVWNNERRGFSWRVHLGIPTDSLVGFLELIKGTLVATQLTQQQQPGARPQPGMDRNRLFGPDGQPWRR